MDVDRNGLEVLDRDECLRLLDSATLGRVAVTSAAVPTVLPVNFRLAGDRIVFRTGKGTKLAAATRNAVVAFEVDDIDPVQHTEWSVVVTGVACPIVDPSERRPVFNVETNKAVYLAANGGTSRADRAGLRDSIRSLTPAVTAGSTAR